MKVEPFGSSDTKFLYIPQTQSEKLVCFEQNVVATYIAPRRNKYPDPHFLHDVDHSFYFSENYNFDSENVPYYSQEVLNDIDLYWENMD